MDIEDKRINYDTLPKLSNGVDLGKENSAPVNSGKLKEHKHLNKDKHREGSSKEKHNKDRDHHKKKHHKEKHRDKKYEDKHRDKSKGHKGSNDSDKKTKEEKTDDGYFTHDTSAYDIGSSDMKVKQEADLDEYDDDNDYVSKKKSRDDDDEYTPEKKKKSKSVKRKIKEDDWLDDVPTKKKVKKEKTLDKNKKVKKDGDSPRKKVKEEQQDVWKWWEEQKRPDGVKWVSLEHKGPVFAPDYEPLPSNIKFYYNGQNMKLSNGAEEVAGFYAKMLDHDYTTKEVFNTNFFKDWRSVMTSHEKSTIVDLSKCNFSEMHKYFLEKSEERKNMTKEEKKALKESNQKIVDEYGYCIIDGHKQRIGNFKIEPPGLFRGRGEHPKQGKLKRRVNPEDVIINCSKDSRIPVPPAGHKWKEVRHDNTVTWLASWTENIANQTKYVMLNAASKLKGEKDWQKYEVARKLHRCVDKIRENYRDDWKSKEMKVRQRAVALYFIDKLALRAGNEKEEGETADTVGCCSLRVEHISLQEEKDGKQYVVTFDFLGKDSIRYYNEIPVEKRVFKNLQLFMENKQPGDDLFDRLTTAVLNKHLNELMEGLTAKVFRTYNASITLQEQLKLLTDPNANVAEKILSYNRANRAVAILCNHQRTAPKTHAKTMENIKQKIDLKEDQVREAQKQFKSAKKAYNNGGSQREKINMEKKKKAFERLKEQLQKLQVQATDKEENKEIALGTSKLNYLDPRITVAWCKKYDVPVERVYNKTQREKFQWAIDMAGPEYIF